MPETSEPGSPASSRADAGAPVTEALGGGRTYRELGPETWALGTLMVLLGAVTAWLIWTGGGIRQSRSYLYLFFYAIPANTAISVFPHEPVVIYFGEFANIWVTGAAAMAGTLVAGFMDHSVFVPVLNLEGKQGYKSHKLYRKGAEWFSRYPFLTLVVAGATPVPFWPFKVLSFSLHYPLWKYMAALTVGRFPRYVVLAWVGMTFPVPKWLLVALFLGILVTYGVKAGPEVVDRLKKALGGDDRRGGRRAPGGDAGPESGAGRDAGPESGTGRDAGEDAPDGVAGRESTQSQSAEEMG